MLCFNALQPAPQQVAVPFSSGVGAMVRPVTGADVGIRRAEIRQGLREIILCKDQDGKVGLRLRSIDNVSQHFSYSSYCTVMNYSEWTDSCFTSLRPHGCTFNLSL